MAETPEQGMLWSAPSGAKPGDRLKIVGIDENGLGPRLGPLVVTGLALESAGGEYDRTGLWKAFADFSADGTGIGDSKEVSGFGDMAGAEEISLALARLLSGKTFESADDFLGFASLTPFEQLCSSPSRTPCFASGAGLPAFAPAEGFPGRIADLADRLSGCATAAGAAFISIRSNIYCPARYNAYFARLPDARKSNLNFKAFEEVIEHFTESFGEQALYLCGKVMNLKFYSKYFDFLSAFEIQSSEEMHLVSEYGLGGLGRVRFIHDGDRLDLPISLASIFGKYVREIYVSRLNGFFGKVFPDLKPASGYNDSVTKVLIDRAKPALRDLAVDPSCFLRQK